MTKKKRTEKVQVVMIAAGMYKPKKDFVSKSVESLYLNYGLLGLATVLAEKGYTVRVFQGDSKEIREIMDEIENAGILVNELKYPLFISIPSFYSADWAIDFTKEIKRIAPSIKVIMGGRWCLDKNLEWAKKKFPDVDCFSLGCGENVVEFLLDEENWDTYAVQQIVNKPFKKIDFSLLNNFREYQPIIEVARGCPNQCDFCLEKDYGVSRAKTPEEVLDEAEGICARYDDNSLNIYFEAAIFNPTVEWAEKFEELYRLRGLKFHWRFETRVDTGNAKAIQILSKAGLKVVDLGLESASPRQLIRMNKCKNPEMYLKKAHDLLIGIKKCGVWAKVNILLYAGETNDTVNETKKWLRAHKECIKGVSVNPLSIYLNGDKSTREYLDSLEKDYSIVIDRRGLWEKGYTFTDLSEEITLEKAKRITNEIVDMMMSTKDYADLKDVGYSRRKI